MPVLHGDHGKPAHGIKISIRCIGFDVDSHSQVKNYTPYQSFQPWISDIMVRDIAIFYPSF
jgi:hypothetical protein